MYRNLEEALEMGVDWSLREGEYEAASTILRY